MGDGFLDEGVHSRRGELQRGVLVEPGRHRDDRDVQPEADERLDIGKDRQGSSHAVGVPARVGDADELDPVDLAEHAGVVAAHLPDSEQSRSQVGHQAPAPASAFTACTMRSRSPCPRDGCTGSDTTSLAAFSVSGNSSPGANRVSDASRWLGTG